MIRLIFFVYSSLLTSALFAQYSYEFKQPVPPEGEVVQTVDPVFFGEYINQTTGTKFVLNTDGISIVTIINSFITKEQVRESSKYEVRNGFLFGVVENDSVPCILEDDKYFFGIKQKITLNDGKNKAIIKKINSQTYVLNFIETKGYSPSKIQFRNNQLIINHFTYPTDTNIFDEIKRKEQIKGENYTFVLLNPDQQEWNHLDKAIIFDTDLLFIKN